MEESARCGGTLRPERLKMSRTIIGQGLAPMLLLLLTLAFPSAVASQGEPAPQQEEAPTAAAPSPSAEEELPAKEDVTEFTLSPKKREQAIAYASARYRLYFVGFVYGVVILLVVLVFRLGPKFRDWAEQVSQRRFLQALVYVPLLLLTLAVLGLPPVIYGQYLSLKYEQSIQSWPSWFWDWTKGELIDLVIMIILISILYAVIRRSPRRWWFYFWLAALPILILILFLSPVVIQPLFFRFTPLEETQPALVTEIGKVVARGGLEIPPERMFEMNASEKFKSINAYVTGFGASKRVVVWDTTLEKATVPQTLFVFGHEMGHYILNHIPKLIAVLAVFLLVFLYFGYRGMHAVLRRWGERWAIRGVTDWASLPVLMLFFSLFGFLAAPVTNTFTRYLEHEADVYGLEVIHGVVTDSPRAAAEAFQVLGEINLADPDPHPFIKYWLYNHPPLNERLVFARTYDPWSKGEQPQFISGP